MKLKNLEIIASDYDVNEKGWNVNINWVMKLGSPKLRVLCRIQDIKGSTVKKGL